MTAGNSLVLWNAEIWSTTWVDWASAGSQDAASLLRTDCSFDDGPARKATTTIQKPTTSHFVTREDGMRASRPTSPILLSFMAFAPYRSLPRSRGAINARAADGRANRVGARLGVHFRVRWGRTLTPGPRQGRVPTAARPGTAYHGFPCSSSTVSSPSS